MEQGAAQNSCQAGAKSRDLKTHPSSSSSPAVPRSIESTKLSIASCIALVGMSLLSVMALPRLLKYRSSEGNASLRRSSANGSWVGIKPSLAEQEHQNTKNYAP